MSETRLPSPTPIEPLNPHVIPNSGARNEDILMCVFCSPKMYWKMISPTA